MIEGKLRLIHKQLFLPAFLPAYQHYTSLLEVSPYERYVKKLIDLGQLKMCRDELARLQA